LGRKVEKRMTGHCYQIGKEVGEQNDQALLADWEEDVEKNDQVLLADWEGRWRTE
jgi:hypothetical protein